MWREPNESDIQSAMTSEEFGTLRGKLIAAGQTDPFAAILGQVTYMFREAIRSNPANTLDETPSTLPEAAIFHAVAIIRHRLLSRFNTSLPSDARMEEFKAAQAYLREVAKPNGLAVEQAGAAESAKQPVPPMAVNESPRRDGWRDQDGV